MAQKSFSIVTPSIVPFLQNVQLLFTVTANGDQTDLIEANTVFAWELISLSAESSQEICLTWSPGCNFSLRRKNTFDSMSISRRVEPGTYIDFDGHRQWDINTFYCGNENQIIAFNRSNGAEEFVLGAIVKTGIVKKEFQPYVLLKELQTKEGLATDIPCFLQAYIVNGCIRHHLVTEPLRNGLFRQGDKPVPLRLDQLPEKSRYYLYFSDDGRIELSSNNGLIISSQPLDSSTNFSSSSVEMKVSMRSLENTEFHQRTSEGAPPHTKPKIPVSPTISKSLPSFESKVTASPAEPHTTDIRDESCESSRPLSTSQSATSRSQSPKASSPSRCQPQRVEELAPTRPRSSPLDGCGNASRGLKLDMDCNTESFTSSSPQLAFAELSHVRPSPSEIGRNWSLTSSQQTLPRDASLLFRSSQDPSSYLPPLDLTSAVPFKPSSDLVVENDEYMAQDSYPAESGDMETSKCSASEAKWKSSLQSAAQCLSNEVRILGTERSGGTLDVEIVDLIPLRNALRQAAQLIDGQVPHRDDVWGRATLAQFGSQVMPLLTTFLAESPAWNGFKNPALS
ncbi:unnamed protein product [Somion occarium]|uniref:Uncharacterized protein n=1 Tax=Somion occarium TaxID=3059160 RepID=A0ABP1CMJ7_9APHY